MLSPQSNTRKKEKEERNLNCCTVTVLVIPDSQTLRKGAAYNEPKMKPRMKPNAFTYG